MKKRKSAERNTEKIYAYLFLGATIASLLTLWEYFDKSTVVTAGPNFLLPGSLVGPIIFIIFLFMTYSTNQALRKRRFPKYSFSLAVAIAILIILLAVHEVYIGESTGYLYR